jgi:hypothetical protein
MLGIAPLGAKHGELALFVADCELALNSAAKVQ